MKKILLASLLLGTAFCSQINAMEVELTEQQKYTSLKGMLGLYEVTPQNIAIIQDAYRGTYNAEPADTNTISDMLNSQELAISQDIYNQYAVLLKQLEVTVLDDAAIPTIQAMYNFHYGNNPAPEGVVRQIFNKEQAIQQQAADKVEEIYQQQHAVVPAPAQSAKPSFDEARAVAAINLLVKLSDKRRGEDRLKHIDECRKFEKVETAGWDIASMQEAVPYTLSGRLLDEVSEIVSLILESMETPEYGIYLPDFLERKKLYSAFIGLGKLETRGCKNPEERVGLFQKYIGASADVNLVSFTSNPNISYHIIKRTAAWPSYKEGKMCFLNVDDFVKVFEEVAGNWANRHGDWMSPAQMFAEDLHKLFEEFGEEWANSKFGQWNSQEQKFSDFSNVVHEDMFAQSLKILELAKGSTWEEVKAAYKKLALIHHPDKGGDAEEFKKINAAYSYLDSYFEARKKG